MHGQTYSLCIHVVRMINIVAIEQCSYSMLYTIFTCSVHIHLQYNFNATYNKHELTKFSAAPETLHSPTTFVLGTFTVILCFVIVFRSGSLLNKDC